MLPGASLVQPTSPGQDQVRRRARVGPSLVSVPEVGAELFWSRAGGQVSGGSWNDEVPTKGTRTMVLSPATCWIHPGDFHTNDAQAVAPQIS